MSDWPAGERTRQPAARCWAVSEIGYPAGQRAERLLAVCDSESVAAAWASAYATHAGWEVYRYSSGLGAIRRDQLHLPHVQIRKMETKVRRPRRGPQAWTPMEETPKE